MKMLTHTTTTRNTNQSFRINTGKLFSRAKHWEGKLQHSLQTMLKRIFVIHHVAPVRAYSTKGGGGPIRRDILNMD